MQPSYEMNGALHWMDNRRVIFTAARNASQIERH